MTRSISLQVHVSEDLAARVRAAAKHRDISISEWMRSLLTNACDDDDLASQLRAPVDRLSRQSLFLMVGVDALLAGHADHALRERAHQAYARKCRELGLAPSVEGDGA